MMSRLFVFVALCAACLALPTLAHAQAAAPSATMPAPQITATPAREPAAFAPLTQADLSMLTGNVQRPNGIQWFNDRLYTACTGDDTIYEIRADSGATVTYIWGVNNAHTLYAEMQNNALTLWVPDYERNTLVRISRGTVQTVTRNLGGPWGIAPYDEDHFLVSNLLTQTVELIARTGERRAVISGLASPTGIVKDDEFIYVGNNGSARRSIEWYTEAQLTRGINSGQVLVSGVQNVTGMQLASDGKLYFAYSLGTRGVVGRVDPTLCRDGGCTSEQVELVLFTELSAPLAGLTISPDMKLYIHTMFAPEIYWAQL